ncbi:MAG: DUF937 domain-containing protein [Culturomica sp.]|jgi:hypothetical protein|nr:DUF937 domain-containing protein [Culturomica sp.]
MEQYYNGLKSHFTSSVVKLSAKVVEEPEAKVSAAIDAIIKGLLEKIAKNGNKQEIEEILVEAGNLKILTSVATICQNQITPDQQRIGDDLLQHLLGDGAADFTEEVVKKTATTAVSVNRLTDIVAPVVAGYLGETLKKEKLTMTDLVNKLK